MRPGVTIDQARAELTTLWPAVLTAVMPPEYAGAQRQRFLETTIQVREGAKGVEPGLRRRFTQPLVIVMAIALFVVLIACVNIASLMMSRASSRMHEMGVRLALGAGSWRLMRHVLVEGVMLSLVGALFGVLVAMWGSESLVAVILAHLHRAAVVRRSPGSPGDGLHDLAGNRSLACCFPWRRPGGSVVRRRLLPCSAARERRRAAAEPAGLWSRSRWGCRSCC